MRFVSERPAEQRTQSAPWKRSERQREKDHAVAFSQQADREQPVVSQGVATCSRGAAVANQPPRTVAAGISADAAAGMASALAGLSGKPPPPVHATGRCVCDRTLCVRQDAVFVCARVRVCVCVCVRGGGDADHRG